MRRFVAYGPAVLVLVIAIAGWWLIPAGLKRLAAARTDAQVALARQALDTDDILDRMNTSVRNIAAAVEPSVVHVEVTEGGDTYAGASGSGWVYDDRGHIITNAHVVRGAKRIRVQFFDGRVDEGKLVGADILTDVAVIEIGETTGLVPSRRATNIQPQQGERVYAFGSPFGFKFSMSEGIISGVGRIAGPALEMGGFSNLIQTDAAVNPGNSGGPLIDVHGRVVGMNVAIATARSSGGTTGSEGQSAGISFAIPITTVEYVVDQLIEHGRVARGFLGVSFPQASETEQIRYNGEFKGTGLKVATVTPGGPASVAGLRPDDIVVTINEQSTATFANLRAIVSSIRPGQTVRVRAWRKDRFIETEVTLGEMPAEAIVSPFPEIQWQTIRVQLGLDVRPGQGRVLIRSVVPGSPADAAGLESGLAIVAVGSAAVREPKDLALAIVEQGWIVGKDLVLTVEDRSGRRSQVSLRPRGPD